MPKEITQQYLKARLNYDPKTGVFIWITHQLTHRIGKVATKTITGNTLMIRMNNQDYQGAKLAFLYMTGKNPEFIGYRNLDKQDLRYKNLFVSHRRVINNQHSKARKIPELDNNQVMNAIDGRSNFTMHEIAEALDLASITPIAGAIKSLNQLGYIHRPRLESSRYCITLLGQKALHDRANFEQSQQLQAQLYFYTNCCPGNLTQSRLD